MSKIASWSLPQAYVQKQDTAFTSFAALIDRQVCDVYPNDVAHDVVANWMNSICRVTIWVLKEVG